MTKASWILTRLLLKIVLMKGNTEIKKSPTLLDQDEGFDFITFELIYNE